MFLIVEHLNSLEKAYMGLNSSLPILAQRHSQLSHLFNIYERFSKIFRIHKHP